MDYFEENYHFTSIEIEINIEHIISVHYFEYSKNYIFEGEKHDFWEFLYVDKGEINVMADDKNYLLRKGNMIFYKPNEWHNVIANGKVAPNLIVVGFNCNSTAMKYFENKILNIDDSIKNVLANIIKEAMNAYTSDFNDPLLKKLTKRKNQHFASEQLVKLYLEQLLIEIIRKNDSLETNVKTSSSIKEFASEDKVRIVMNFLKENINNKLTLEDICKSTLLSRSSLQKLFKETIQMSVMEYFKQLKIEEAKVLIREGNHNFTGIATILGYNSIHYFSRTFKNTTGMTLSEYASSVKVKI